MIFGETEMREPLFALADVYGERREKHSPGLTHAWEARGRKDAPKELALKLSLEARVQS